jgi:hypothetical protein
MQDKYFKKGDTWRKAYNQADDMCLRLENLKLTEKSTVISKQDETISKKGQDGQGEGLTAAKRGNKK